jgi:hypothetical protein
VAPDRWLLKGALSLDYRFGDRARTTRDIDLATSGGEASATADLLAAQALDLNDFFSFSRQRWADLGRRSFDLLMPPARMLEIATPSYGPSGRQQMPDDRHLEASGLAVQGLQGDPGVGADASIDVATDPLYQRSALDLRGDVLVDRRRPDRSGSGACRPDPEACRFEETGQPVEIAQRPIRADQLHRVLPSVAGDSVVEGLEPGLGVAARPDLHRDRPAWLHDPRHLTERPRRLRKEHQRSLAEHDVERLVVEGQSGGVSLDPIDVRPEMPGDDEHGLVQIETDDSPASSLRRR